MSLTKLTKDIAYHQKQVDEPNDVGGLTADGLKAIFDKAALDIKDFLNGNLIDELDNIIDILKGEGWSNESLKGLKNALETHKSSADHDGRYYTESEVNTILQAYTTINDITNNRKLSANGDFTGSWHGIKTPAYAEPGQAAVVQSHTEQLDDIAINIIKFGASEDNPDNHNAIMSAIDYAYNNGGGTVLIPIGIFKTSPLVLTSYKNIHIKGAGSNTTPWTKCSQLKFISYGKVGIQLADCDSETPSWYSREITISDLYINCDNKVDVGVNGNNGIYLNNITVDYAIKDGIVLEGMSYPFIINRAWSRYNGRHGIYVKAPYSTVYSFNHCECFGNNGYGMVIEDGNTSNIQNCLLQGNKQGGLKILYKNPTLFTKPIFLNNLSFSNLYLEDNGKLLNTDPNYEGNYSVKIDSYDHVKNNNNGKIQSLTFINTGGVKSNEGSIALIQGISSLSILGSGAYFFNSSTIDYNACGTIRGAADIDITATYGYNESDWSQTAKTYREQIYCNPDISQIIKVGHGYLGKRGRMRELDFVLPSINAGETKLMNTVFGDNMRVYPTLQAGSILGAIANMIVKPSSGSLTFKLKWGYITNGTIESGGYYSTDTLTINTSKNCDRRLFDLLKYKISNDQLLGVEVVASADYAPLNTTYPPYQIVTFQLFIEN
jgi:hypothetical protein